LFAPGSRADLIAKARTSGADALIYDLEDSVAPTAKAEARRNVHAALAAAGSVPVYVRVNHPETGDTRADIDALAAGRVEGIVLPKAEHAQDIARVAQLLAAAERRLALAEGALAIVPMIETCRGLRNAHDIATASPRVRGIALASAEEGDLMADHGGRWTPGGDAMAYPRGHLVCEARAAGVTWLIDGVFMQFNDADALRRECALARNVGYTAKMAIHPRQLDAIHAVFTPSEAEIDHASELLAAFRAAEAQGSGAIRFRGMMVDAANAKRAERTLALAKHSQRAPELAQGTERSLELAQGTERSLKLAQGTERSLKLVQHAGGDAPPGS
jgi:citrate lyase subunit beta/citryl-CoA lyase